MSYIGKEPQVGGYNMLDSLTASATASYSLTLDSVAFVPESANHLDRSLNGVIQKAGSSFTVSGSTLTFSSALTSSDSIDFVLALGNVLDIGTPSDGTVTNAKTNFVSTSSAAGLQIKGDGTTDGTLQLNCSQNSHGIKLKSPAHSAGASYTLTFPTTDGNADEFLQTNGSGVLSWASAGGITEADSWRINTSFSIGNTSFNDLTSNLERDDSTGFGYLGTGMSQSSGVFTFPSTGIYLIFQTWTTYDNADFAWFEGFIRTTTDNSSYATRSQVSTHVVGRTSGSPEITATGMCMFDVTDTSQCKLQFGYQSSDAATNVYGGNTANVTSFQFIRLGDT